MTSSVDSLLSHTASQVKRAHKKVAQHPQTNSKIQECFGSCQSLIDMLENNENHPAHDILEKSLLDLQRSAYFLSSLMYQSYFVHLRLGFEKFLHGVYLSYSDYDYRLWQAGQKEFVWEAVRSKETGLFAKNRIRAYDTRLDAKSDEFHALASSVYSECSRVVHGNFETYSQVTADFVWDEAQITACVEKFESIYSVCVFVWCCRFARNSHGSVQSLEELLFSALGRDEVVESLFSETRRG